MKILEWRGATEVSVQRWWLASRCQSMESALSQQLWRVLQLLSQRGAVSGLSSRTGAIASPGSLKGTRRIEHYLPREVAGGIAKDGDQRRKVRGEDPCKIMLSECALRSVCGPCPRLLPPLRNASSSLNHPRTSPSLCVVSDICLPTAC